MSTTPGSDGGKKGSFLMDQVDPSEFVATKIISLAGLIYPEETMICLLTNMRVLAKAPCYPVITRYQSRALLQDGAKGAVCLVENVMMIDHCFISCISSGAYVFLRSMAYWNIVFEGVRRFVLEHVVAKNDLIPAQFLVEICEKNSHTHMLYEQLIQFYVDGDVTEEELRTEIDVQTIAFITQAAMLDAIKHRREISYEDVIHYLKLGKSGLTPEVVEKIMSFV